MNNLTIQTILDFGKEDGNLKINAIKCILGLLHEGGMEKDLRIILRSGAVGTIRISVEFGGLEPAIFYYNEPDEQGEPGYISVERRGIRMSPVIFVATINKLIQMAAA